MLHLIVWRFLLLLDSVSNMLSQTIAINLKYPNGTVKHAGVDEDADAILGTANLVIYGSFTKEHTFPGMLLKAMCFGKPIVAPDLPMITKYVGIYCLYSLIKFSHFYIGRLIIGQCIACYSN